MNTEQSSGWFADDAEDDDGIHIDHYDITASPNDFNLVTLGNFIDRGAIRIPGFQRHFVWDLPRASRLIESFILGIPVPQLFLYEESRNRFLVIDGQQRLMSIYYFIKQRFPRPEHRQRLRAIFDDAGRIPDEILNDDDYFRPFRLRLSARFADRPSRFDGLDYDSLGEYQSQFDLRPLRNIVVKQVSPSDDDDSSVFEIFNRLNTGGMNLRPQEIRTSMYHSRFYTMLYDMNTYAAWRSLLGAPEPDLHLKDIEVILRGFAMLIDGDAYAPSMLRFLNRFSKKCKQHNNEQNEYLKGLFGSFLGACGELSNDFLNPHDHRFNIMLYEGVFTAACARAFAERRRVTGVLSADRVRALRKDREFIAAATSNTTSTANVKKRLSRALDIVGAL